MATIGSARSVKVLAHDSHPMNLTNATKVIYPGGACRPWSPRKLCRQFVPKWSFSSFSGIVTRRGPFRLAVIGSGPAGFYAAYRVMSKMENAVVDMYEHLPVPYGLVRFGVAPDHPEVKNCQDKFAEVASSSRFSFVGNIDVGKDLSLAALKPHYDAFLFAYGASQDRQLGIPGENSLKGVYSARAFVGWYNGLPEYANLQPNLEAGEEAVIIGQGNVALDVARTLLSNIDRLKETDITQHALSVLAKSRITRVQVVGRRGPYQAPFSNKELRELMTLSGVSFTSLDHTILSSEPQTLPRPQRRLTELLKGSLHRPEATKQSWSLSFMQSPSSFNASTSNPSILSSITFNKTAFSDSSHHLSPAAKVVSTASTTTVPTSTAFRSIGYKSSEIPGMTALGIPFNANLGIIPNDSQGRVLTTSRPLKDGTAEVIPGVYCAGWVKRGPTGVIASTMEDAFATAEAIVEDWETRRRFLHRDGDGPKIARRGWDFLRDEVSRSGLLRPVSWEDWLKIDAVERVRGKEKGKIREKFTSVKAMLEVID